MTNSNDFRQYSYKYDTQRLISSFNYTRGSQVQRVRPEYDDAPRRNLKIKEAKGIKSRDVLEREEKVSVKKVIRIVIAAALLITMFGFVLNSFAVKNQLTRKIASQETEIANAQSENISLQSKLNVLYSVSMVDKYATDKLNMSKVRQGQIQYIDVDEYIASQKNRKKPASKNSLTPAQAAVAAAKKAPEKDKADKKSKADDEEDSSSSSSDENSEENDNSSSKESKTDENTSDSEGSDESSSDESEGENSSDVINE